MCVSLATSFWVGYTVACICTSVRSTTIDISVGMLWWINVTILIITMILNFDIYYDSQEIDMSWKCLCYGLVVVEATVVLISSVIHFCRYGSITLVFWWCGIMNAVGMVGRFQGRSSFKSVGELHPNQWNQVQVFVIQVITCVWIRNSGNPWQNFFVLLIERWFSFLLTFLSCLW